MKNVQLIRHVEGSQDMTSMQTLWLLKPIVCCLFYNTCSVTMKYNIFVLERKVKYRMTRHDFYKDMFYKDKCRSVQFTARTTNCTQG